MNSVNETNYEYDQSRVCCNKEYHKNKTLLVNFQNSSNLIKAHFVLGIIFDATPVIQCIHSFVPVSLYRDRGRYITILPVQRHVTDFLLAKTNFIISYILQLFVRQITL